jgi:hypothetical protein
MLDVRPHEILACFTQARRLHEGRTRCELAKLLGIRADQVAKAENGRPCGEAAHQLLPKWNGLEISRERSQ